MGRRHLWKPREASRALERLGFTKDAKRGKGDHVWFYQRVLCLNNEPHTITTMVDMGVSTIPYKTMDYILDALALDDDTLVDALKGYYTAIMYRAYLLTVPKTRLMPPAMRR